MATKADSARVDAKRLLVAATIQEIAPHANVVLFMLDEVKIDLLLIALVGARLPDLTHQQEKEAV